MSAGITAFCEKCRRKIHLGLSSGSGPSFGYGKNDVDGHKLVAAFIAKHVYCDLERGVRCTLSDHAPLDYDEVEWWPGSGRKESE